MGIVSGIKAVLSVKKLKKGKIASLSIAQISTILINLVDAKSSLPPDKYNQVYELFLSLQKHNKKIEMNWLSYLATCADIIKEFEAIAPYKKYSGASMVENGLWEKVISMHIATTHNYATDKEYFDPIKWASTKRLDYAYAKIVSFGLGFYACGNKNEFGGLMLYISNCCNFCAAWCIFCGNKEEKNKIIEAKNKVLAEFSNLGPQNIEMSKTMDEIFSDNFSALSKYRKEVILPAYKENPTKENYNDLLVVYLEGVCKLLNIDWYDGIVEDFKHCMDE